MSISNTLKPWIIVAPHLEYPLRNGADLYAVGVAKGISFSHDCLLIGASTVEWYHKGAVTKKEAFTNQPRTKVQAGIISLLTGRSYQEVKFVTPAFRKFLKQLTINPDSNIAYSFNSTAVLDRFFRSITGQRVVLTHNFDIAFFRNIQKNLSNPISRLAAGRMLTRADQFLQKNQANFIYAHNNEADQLDYAALYPAMRHVLLKVGVDAPDTATLQQLRDTHLSYGGPIRICFTGYLGSAQNFEALEFFANKYWPVLRDKFGDQIVFAAIGSSPGTQVTAYCERMGWELQQDLDDAAFASAIAACHYSVLPFPFTSGTKHKLFTSVAKGVPFLATTCIKVQLDGYPSSCLFSDDAAAWAEKISAGKDHLREPATIEGLHDFIQEHSWKKACSDFLQQLAVG